MANIQKLLEPINSKNTVNIINIYKEDYLPNIYVNPKKIKGKHYSNNYIITDPKVGERKIKDFVNSRLQGPFGIVSKAVSIKKKFFLPKTDVEKYMFILTASKEDLKKVKPEDYFGLRLSNNNTLFDFDKRLIFHNVEADEEGRIKVDKEDSEPMFDMLKYQSIFINKKNYKPIQRYNVNYDFETPNFVIKQQEGAEPSFVFKDSENNDIEDSEIDINTLYDDYYNAENQLRNYSLRLLSKYIGDEATTAYMSMPTANIIDLVEKYHNENVIKDTQYNGFTDILKKYNYLEHLIQSRQPNYNEVF